MLNCEKGEVAVGEGDVVWGAKLEGMEGGKVRGGAGEKGKGERCAGLA